MYTFFNRNYFISFQKIEDNPVDGTDVYIIMIGEFLEKVYLDLIEKHDVPIASITYFFPDEWLRKIRYFRCYQHISFLRNAVQTKNIRVNADFLPVLSECLGSRFAPEINNYLTYLLYDNEVMFNRNYQVFLNNFKEFDVDLKEECRSFNYGNIAKNCLTTYVNVYNFYANLVEQIESIDDVSMFSEAFDRFSNTISTRESTTSILFSQKSFEKIKSNVGSTVFEEANFLKTHLASNDELEVDSSELESIFLRKMMIDITSCRVRKDFRNLTPNPKFFFYEPLTLVSLAQRLEIIFKEFKFVEGFSYYRNWKALIFEKKHNYVNHTMRALHLNTKTCFKDFATYVFPKKPVLIKEPLFSVTSEKAARLSLMNSVGHINYNDFIRLRSLKQTVPQHVEDYSKAGDQTHYPIKFSKVMDEFSHVEGYNLSDSYFQLTESSTEIYTSNGNLRLVTNSWLYRHDEMEAHLTILDNQFIFNRIFDKDNRKKMRIITSNQIVICVDFAGNKPKVNMLWPNGRIIRNLEIKKDLTRKFIEFRSKKVQKYEHRRIYMSDGSIVYFLLDRQATAVCRYNGLVVKAPVVTLTCNKENESTKSESQLEGEECEEESLDRSPFKFDLEWLKNTGELFGFDGSSCVLRPSTGQCFEVHCGEITENNHTFAKHIKRDFSYSGGTITESGEQGILMQWSCPGGLTTNYKVLGCKLAIKTFTSAAEPLLDWEFCKYLFSVFFVEGFRLLTCEFH